MLISTRLHFFALVLLTWIQLSRTQPNATLSVSVATEKHQPSADGSVTTGQTPADSSVTSEVMATTLSGQETTPATVTVAQVTNEQQTDATTDIDSEVVGDEGTTLKVVDKSGVKDSAGKDPGDIFNLNVLFNTTHPVKYGAEADDFWHEDVHNGTEHCHCGCEVKLNVGERWSIIRGAAYLDFSVAFFYTIGMVLCVKYYGLENPNERFVFSAQE